jgi:hypothetical protein
VGKSGWCGWWRVGESGRFGMRGKVQDCRRGWFRSVWFRRVDVSRVVMRGFGWSDDSVQNGSGMVSRLALLRYVVSK